MRVKTNWVPSAFTMANLFCGYYSVILSANGKFMYAAWLIVAAAVMDALDGKIARFAKADSPFGVEYDSLADVVSFGFAPSFLAYKVEFIEWGTIGLLISFGPLVFGSIRLARFNIKLKGLSKDFFEGLPIPAAAVSIATFVVFNYHFWEYLRFIKMFLFIVLAVSILMVTSIRYETLPSFTLQSGIANRVKFLFVMLGIIIIAVVPQETFFPISVIYILSGPIRGAWLILRSGQKTKKKKRNSSNESSD